MALEQYTNGEQNSSVRNKINSNFGKLTPKSGLTFTGVFTLDQYAPKRYNDYLSGSVVNLSIAANPVLFGSGTVKIKGGLVGTIPNNWARYGSAISTDANQTNIIIIGYFGKNTDGTDDIRMHNMVLGEVVASDITAPAFITGYPVAANVLQTSFDVQVQLNEAGTAYLVIVPDGQAAPTSQEVKDGTATNSIASRNVAVTAANTTATMGVTGVVEGTAYDIYVVAEDDEANPNLQANPVKVDVTTQGGATAISSYGEFTNLDSWIDATDQATMTNNGSDKILDITAKGSSKVFDYAGYGAPNLLTSPTRLQFDPSGATADAMKSTPFPFMTIASDFSIVIELQQETALPTVAFFVSVVDLNNRFSVSNKNGKLSVGAYDGTDWVYKHSTADFTDVASKNVISAEYAGGAINVWLNGVALTGTDSANTPVPSTTADVSFIGGNNGGGAHIQLHHLVTKTGAFTQAEKDFIASRAA